MSFIGQSRPLTSTAISRTAADIGVGVQEIWTVIGVETLSCGFLPDRRPTILYERHLFHRLTRGRFDDGDLSDAAPGGYGAQGAHQYDRLAGAIAMDRQAALKSTSWGLGQVLGGNFALAGFANVEQMVEAMSNSEDAQLEALRGFIVARKLDAALRSHDWAAFARGYNGTAFAINHYDVRLRGEFEKISAGVLPNVDIRAAQLYLIFRGFHPGPVDGFVGPLTRSAIRDFRRQNGLSESDLVDDELLEKLVV